MDIGNDNSKLVPTNANKNCAGAHNCGKPLRNFNESLIPNRVPISIGDRFESIEVKHKHRPLRVGSCGNKNFGKGFHEKTAFGKSSQWITANEILCFQFGATSGLHFTG